MHSFCAHKHCTCTVFIGCVGVMSEADDTEARTEKMTVTFKSLREGLVYC